jgi:hypothetical protein
MMLNCLPIGQSELKIVDGPLGTTSRHWLPAFSRLDVIVAGIVIDVFGSSAPYYHYAPAPAGAAARRGWRSHPADLPST